MSPLRVLALAMLALEAGCTCVSPNASLTYQCEEDGTCLQPGTVCLQGLCVPRSSLDAGHPDGGDAGPDAGGLDAGEFDAGLDGGELDAGPRDAGPSDAGPNDAGAADAGGDAGCVPQGADLPDDLHLDSNCDGVDGDAAQAVFVAPSGDDLANDGSRAQPFATVARALQAGRAQVLVSEGTYVGALTLSAGGVYGGYQSGRGWAREGARPQLVGRVLLATDGGAAVLDFLRVTAPDGVGAGAASIALEVFEATAAVVVRRCELVAGNGADGALGAPGLSGLDGGAGGAGVGSLGGRGGLSACAASAAGADGGAGGVELSINGAPGEPLGLGGAGGTGVSPCPTGPCAANDGNDGGAGVVAADALAGGPGSGTGLVSDAGWLPVNGLAGPPALAGTPGRGGGGGGAVVDSASSFVVPGGGGGGAGAGGCGGLGGLGGGSGGASIAVLLVRSSPTLEQLTLTTGRGGNGQPGGPGGAPGAGGAGGAGAPVTVNGRGTSGAGGHGGRGGNGGRGGPGGPGGGGPSVGILCGPGSAPTVSGTSFTLGVAGAGAPPAPSGLSANTSGCP